MIGEERKGCFGDFFSNRAVYITICSLLIGILVVSLFFTFVGEEQPFEELIEGSSISSESTNNENSSLQSSVVSSYGSKTNEESSVESSIDEVSSIEASESESSNEFSSATEEPQTKSESFMFMHITDIHGWVAGHKHQESYNADIGDFASLMEHLLVIPDKTVMLIDSGDIIEGTGISDVPEIHGEKLFPIMQKVPGFAALTIGNHDIGRADTVELMQENFIPFFNSGQKDSRGRYLTSNSLSDNGELLGNSYSIRVTPQGNKILFLGFLYNFEYFANNTEVLSIYSAVQEDWFLEAMEEPEIDLIIVTAHVDPQSTYLDDVYSAIRDYHEDVALLIFSGHRHILYFKELDDYAYTIESGRYFEHVGIVEFEFENGFMNDFSHRWINASVSEFHELSKKDESDFITDLGREVKGMINDAMNDLHLLEVLGCSTMEYKTSSHFFDEDSLYRFYLDSVLTTVVDQGVTNATGFFVCNSATLRYNLYAGEITRDDVYTINPFKDLFYYLPSLTSEQIVMLQGQMNKKKFNSKIDRVPYLKEGQATVGYTRYYYSSTDIDEDSMYDFICPEYDTNNWQEVFDELFPDAGIVFQLYPTQYDATSCLLEYVQQEMQCNVTDCICYSILG